MIVWEHRKDGDKPLVVTKVWMMFMLPKNEQWVNDGKAKSNELKLIRIAILRWLLILKLEDANYLKFDDTIVYIIFYI